jgi:hypothetical protein
VIVLKPSGSGSTVGPEGKVSVSIAIIIIISVNVVT